MSHLYEGDDDFDPSQCSQLDYVGTQPGSRDWLEYNVNCARTIRAFDQIAGNIMDNYEGIQFSGKP